MMLRKLKGLKADKSPRKDGLQPRVLKEIAEEIVEALMVIFQESLESGRVQEDWKMSNGAPLFKKGGRQKTGNYRPVSLTSVIGPSQYCFIKRRACLTNLLEFFEEVMSKLDTEPVGIIYLDFQKAFDKVPHRRLTNKIRAHGIRDK
eukprot:g36966.t1